MPDAPDPTAARAPHHRSRRAGALLAGTRGSGPVAAVMTVAATAAVVATLLDPGTVHAVGRGRTGATATAAAAPTTTSTTSTTTTTLPAGGPPPCTPAVVAGGAYAVGDSVMVDAQQALAGCLPGTVVDASVSRQWSDGEVLLHQVMAQAAPPAVVVVGLGTNGPVTDADFDAMMTVLQRAARVVFVTVHVDRPWQDQVNAVLARGVARHPTAVLADWQAVARQHPEWFYADGTHLPIGGPGAQALAAVIAAEA